MRSNSSHDWKIIQVPSESPIQRPMLLFEMEHSDPWLFLGFFGIACCGRRTSADRTMKQTWLTKPDDRKFRQYGKLLW
jgi:hypothetical protein